MLICSCTSAQTFVVTDIAAPDNIPEKHIQEAREKVIGTEFYLLFSDNDVRITAKPKGEQAESIVWPKVEVIAKVNHCLPLELKDLVASIKKSKKPTLIDNIHSILGNIKGGYYTFSFHLADIHDEHWFVGNVSKQIKLKKREVLAILRHVCNDDELFSGIAHTSLDEDFINKKAETIDFSADYPYKNITWYCEEFDGYIELWESKIEQVMRKLNNIYIDRQYEK